VAFLAAPLPHLRRRVQGLCGREPAANTGAVDDRKRSLSQSISYFRIAAVASVVCGAGSVIIGGLSLGRADEGRVFVGMGLSQIALGLVMLTLSVACFQLVARLRAQQHRQQHPG
jgi:hypothetical protein